MIDIYLSVPYTKISEVQSTTYLQVVFWLIFFVLYGKNKENQEERKSEKFHENP